jgi:hypothetical protein
LPDNIHVSIVAPLKNDAVSDCHQPTRE